MSFFKTIAAPSSLLNKPINKLGIVGPTQVPKGLPGGQKNANESPEEEAKRRKQTLLTGGFGAADAPGAVVGSLFGGKSRA